MIKYSDELAQEICNRISDGETVTAICEDDDMPCARSVFNWKRDNPEFFDLYYKARLNQLEFFIDQIIDIADDKSEDYAKDAKTGRMAFNKEHVNRSRLRIDIRKFHIMKIAAKIPNLAGHSLDRKIEIILEELAAGNFSADMANTLISVIGGVAKIREADSFEKRIESLEKTRKSNRKMASKNKEETGVKANDHAT